MSWLYITPEQGAIIDSICEEFCTEPGYRPNDCPACPLAAMCKCDADALPPTEPELTRAFEQGLWGLAQEATKR